MKNIIIVGAGGFGRVVLGMIENWNALNLSQNKEPEWNILGFKDDKLVGQKVHGYEVWEIEDKLSSIPLGYIVAIGNCKDKISVVKRMCNVNFYKMIHPGVVLYNNILIGDGSFFCPPGIVSTDIVIGKHVAINSMCSIGEDVVIGDYCTINASNINGGVKIGNGVFLGSGCVTRNGISIGDNSIIGAGAVVVTDIPSNVVAVGVPAKVIKEVV